jgi:hypothetical protein
MQRMKEWVAGGVLLIAAISSAAQPAADCSVLAALFARL